MDNYAGTWKQSNSSIFSHRNAMFVLAIRFIYRQVRLRRGLGRITMITARHLNSLQLTPVPMNNGRVLYLDLRLPMCMPYLLLGEHPYEHAETGFVCSVVHAEDTCLDIGANVGWYSTLLSEAVGAKGKVYAFDPNQRAQKMLNASALLYPQMQVIPLALSDHIGNAVLHIPSEEVKASLWRSPGANESQSCQITTLDKFVQDEGLTEVTFVKCDAEGAELSILNGAKQLLSGDRPPMWMMEISPETNSWAGYRPAQLFEFFASIPNSQFTAYRIDPETGKLSDVPDQIDTVLYAIFVPNWLQHRISIRSAR